MFDVRALFAALRRRGPADAASRAAALVDAGRFEEAVAAFEGVLGSEDLPAPRRAFAHNKRGVALIALGKRDDALAAFGDALAAVGDYAPALVNLGNVALEDGDLEGAIGRYNAAIRADEAYAGAYFNLSVALKRSGRSSEAVRSLKKAFRLEGRRRS
jgi:tetratricopeptide (TPR) repeat protein